MPTPGGVNVGKLEQTEAAAVAGSPRCRVFDRQEQAAAILVKPPHRQPPADRGRGGNPAGLVEAGLAIRAGVDPEPLRTRGPLDG